MRAEPRFPLCVPKICIFCRKLNKINDESPFGFQINGENYPRERFPDKTIAKIVPTLKRQNHRKLCRMGHKKLEIAGQGVLK